MFHRSASNHRDYLAIWCFLFRISIRWNRAKIIPLIGSPMSCGKGLFPENITRCTIEPFLGPKYACKSLPRVKIINIEKSDSQQKDISTDRASAISRRQSYSSSLLNSDNSPRSFIILAAWYYDFDSFAPNVDNLSRWKGDINRATFC